MAAGGDAVDESCSCVGVGVGCGCWVGDAAGAGGWVCVAGTLVGVGIDVVVGAGITVGPGVLHAVRTILATSIEIRERENKDIFERFYITHFEIIETIIILFICFVF